MMKKIYSTLIILCFTTLHTHYLQAAHTKQSTFKPPYQALVTVPVADALSRPAFHLDAKKSVATVYDHLPIASPEMNDACSRLHQLLFNTVVTVLDEHKDEALVSVFHVLYHAGIKNTPRTRYWVKKTTLTPLAHIQQRTGSYDCIPPVVLFKKNTLARPEPRPIIALTMPWHDTTTNQTYSAGTRFVMLPNKSTQTLYAVDIYDPTTNRLQTGYIPKNSVLDQSVHRSQQQKIMNFVSIARSWAHLNNGFVPYIWGGCSFTLPYKQKEFTKQSGMLYGKQQMWFERSQHKTGLQTGLDCSGLILCAAQLAQIPFYFKNTKTIAQYLQPVMPHDAIQNGDLIYFPGHVIMISDVQKNLVIEAHHYAGDYGLIHEQPLKKLFKNVTTFDQLRKLCEKKQPIIRLKKDGTALQTIQSCSILSMRSSWKFDGNKVG